MRYQTDLMRAILTNETAREIIDWVSQLYGESYVGLWVYQVIGFVLGEIRAMAEQLRKEVQPNTAVQLLDLWEDSYGQVRDPALTTAQRQARLAMWRLTRGPASPYRLEQAATAATGYPVLLTENIEPYTFSIGIICDEVMDLDEIAAKLRWIKPAHQQMELYLIVGEGGVAIGYPVTAVIAGDITDSVIAERH